MQLSKPWIYPPRLFKKKWKVPEPASAGAYREIVQERFVESYRKADRGLGCIPESERSEVASTRDRGHRCGNEGVRKISTQAESRWFTDGLKQGPSLQAA